MGVLTDWPKINRRSLLLAAGIASVLPVTTGCQAVAVAAANPAVQGWLVALGANLGATIVTDLSKKGPDKTFSEWTTGFWSLYQKWFPDRGQNGCAGTRQAYLATGTPTFILVRTVAQQTSNLETCRNAPYDPLNDGCAVVINKGMDGFHLPAWAWHTLAMFCSDMVKDKSGADLERIKALLRVSLAPISSQVARSTSWAQAVAYISYVTHVGPVDIAKIEKSDHSFNGMIKVGGFPDESRRGTVWEFVLPTRRG